MSNMADPKKTRRGRALDTSTAGDMRVPGTEDWSLARDGDQAAFERLYRSHVARIHSLARRMAGEEAADDLTQEVFIRAWEKLGTFRGDAEFGTWLHRLAVNLILSRRTSLRKREARFPTVEAPILAAGARPARPGVRMDVEKALGKLPDGARKVFVLYDVEGFAHDEIAERMGISVGTSKSQLHRARMILRNFLA
jgi:RNA polymerase sigma-70 factor (ECF subfamily)